MMKDVADMLGEDRKGKQQTSDVFAKAFKTTESNKNLGTFKAPKIKKPDGMARELFNLINKDDCTQSQEELNSMVAQPTKINFKYSRPKARVGRREAHTWCWQPFDHSSRMDNLKLAHWIRKDKADDDYPFARFNKVLRIVTYTEEEYNTHLYTENWSKSETDHLMELCQRFDLRWPVIWDRWDKASYPSKTSIEHLKERYYSVTNSIAKIRTPEGEEAPYFSYNAKHNKQRRQQLELLWSRTNEEIEEEEELIEQLKRIEARKRERERKAADLQKLISAHEKQPISPAPTSIASASSILGNRTGDRKSNQSRSTRTMAQNWATIAAATANQTEGAIVGIKFSEQRSSGPHLRSSEMKLPNIGQKKFKAIELLLNRFETPEMNSRGNPYATAEIAQAFNDLRSDMSLLYELHTHINTLNYSVQELKAKLEGTPDAFQIPDTLQKTFDAAERHVTAVQTAKGMAQSAAAAALPPPSVTTRTTAVATPQQSPAPSRDTTPLSDRKQQRRSAAMSSDVLRHLRRS